MDIDEVSSDGDDGWDELEEEDEEFSGVYRSLFSSAEFTSIEEALRHDVTNHGFDFAEFRNQAALDEFETIMCVNYIRSLVSAGQDAVPQLAAAVSSGERPWKHDRYMQPVLSNDAFLLHDWDDEDNLTASRQQARGSSSNITMDALVQENAVLRSAVLALAEYLPPEIAATMFQSVGDESAAGVAAGMARLELDQPSSSGQGPSRPLVQKARGSSRPGTEAIDAQYFESYSQFGIHREMLSDTARTEAYMEALEKNPSTIGGATVLDVGCGTGILSMSAARGRAGRVIGVDGSKVMAKIAEENCKANGLAYEQGGPVSILAGRLEELPQLPVDKVDIIVSEWMGYALLFETMLDTVLFARDRYLKPGGAMFPDVATLYVGGAGVDALGTSFWRQVYGFSMEPVAASIQAGAQGKAIVAEVAQADMVTESAVLRRLDLATMAATDADFSSDFELPALPQASGASCHAVVLWFDVDFSARFCPQHPVNLTTSPYAKQTHWAQTILPLKAPVELKSASDVLRGRISIARSNQHRCLDISLEYRVRAEGGKSVSDSIACSYQIAMS